jgi:hypothetical protein
MIDSNKISHIAPKIAEKNTSLSHAHPLLKTLDLPFHIFPDLHFKRITFLFPRTVQLYL